MSGVLLTSEERQILEKLAGGKDPRARHATILLAYDDGMDK